MLPECPDTDKVFLRNRDFAVFLAHRQAVLVTLYAERRSPFSRKHLQVSSQPLETISMEDMEGDSWCFGVQVMLRISTITLVLKIAIILTEKLHSQAQVFI